MKWRSPTRNVRLPVLIACACMVTAAPLSPQEIEKMPDNELIFTTVAYPVEWSEANALLLIESIRDFGGELSQSTIWCFVPDFGPKPSQTFQEKMTALNAELLFFEIERETARFFFAADIRAAALAESLALGKTDILVWLSSNTIILKEPEDLLLADGKNLGYRPVHHTNVGSIYDNPIDAFWSLVYTCCEVPEDRIFPMKTHVDNNNIRPYFNAGMLALRPEKGLFKLWQDKFFHVYKTPEFSELYERDERYVIFIHQALLSGIILSTFALDEIQELPTNYNYPLHLYEEDITAHRPSRFGELVIVRHEGLNRIPEWVDKIPGGEQFKRWFADRK